MSAISKKIRDLVNSPSPSPETHNNRIVDLVNDLQHIPLMTLNLKSPLWVGLSYDCFKYNDTHDNPTARKVEIEINKYLFKIKYPDILNIYILSDLINELPKNNDASLLVTRWMLNQQENTLEDLSAAILQLPFKERINAIFIAAPLIDPEMDSLTRADCILGLALIPEEQRSQTPIIRMIKRIPSYSARVRVFHALKAIPLPDRARIIRHADYLLQKEDITENSIPTLLNTLHQTPEKSLCYALPLLRSPNHDIVLFMSILQRIPEDDIENVFPLLQIAADIQALSYLDNYLIFNETASPSAVIKVGLASYLVTLKPPMTVLLDRLLSECVNEMAYFYPLLQANVPLVQRMIALQQKPIQQSIELLLQGIANAKQKCSLSCIVFILPEDDRVAFIELARSFLQGVTSPRAMYTTLKALSFVPCNERNNLLPTLRQWLHPEIDCRLLIRVLVGIPHLIRETAIARASKVLDRVETGPQKAALLALMAHIPELDWEANSDILKWIKTIPEDSLKPLLEEIEKIQEKDRSVYFRIMVIELLVTEHYFFALRTQLLDDLLLNIKSLLPLILRRSTLMHYLNNHHSEAIKEAVGGLDYDTLSPQEKPLLIPYLPPQRIIALARDISPNVLRYSPFS